MSDLRIVKEVVTAAGWGIPSLEPSLFFLVWLIVNVYEIALALLWVLSLTKEILETSIVSLVSLFN
jgi:hypothetical protein